MTFADHQLIFLYTDDLETSARFYGEVMGLPLAQDQGRCKLFQAAPGAIVGVCDLAHRERGTAGITLSFVVADVDATYEKLRSKGVVFDGPPKWGMGGMVYGCFFRDPNGYRLEIQSFRDADWNKVAS